MLARRFIVRTIDCRLLLVDRKMICLLERSSKSVAKSRLESTARIENFVIPLYAGRIYFSPNAKQTLDEFFPIAILGNRFDHRVSVDQ